jgi:arsenate reductase (thioredoxin)
MQMLKILFLCTGNSCRSQMAEGWARHLKRGEIEAYSAGVDISGQRSKHVDDLANVNFDYVVTVCDHAHESCPVFPGRARIVRRRFDDPPRLASSAATEAERLAPYRRVRDEIREYVAKLPDRLCDEHQERGRN